MKRLSEVVQPPLKFRCGLPGMVVDEGSPWFTVLRLDVLSVYLAKRDTSGHDNGWECLPQFRAIGDGDRAIDAVCAPLRNRSLIVELGDPHFAPRRSRTGSPHRHHPGESSSLGRARTQGWV